MENTNQTTPVPEIVNQNPPPHGAIYANGEGKSPAFHFFLYLVSFLSLSFVAVAIGTILYQIINKNFSDNAGRYSGYFEQAAVRFGIASLIIAAPLYFFITFLITKYLFQGKIDESSRVRKWITYIVLFLAAATILGGLVTLVYMVLDGEIITRFILKVLVVLGIAGAIFGYYLWDIRKQEMQGTCYAGNKVAAFSSLGIILVVFISAFFVVDGPRTVRNKKIDSRTVSTMQRYKNSIENYYNKNNKLPENITDLQGGSYYFPRNIEGNPITYKKSGVLAYQLCADFKRSALEDNKEKNRDYYYDLYNDYGSEWKYDKGYYCFPMEVKAKTVETPPMKLPSSPLVPVTED